MIHCNFCGKEIPFEPAGIGRYVGHLIREHWDVLQTLHDTLGEWDIESIPENGIVTRSLHPRITRRGTVRT